MLKKVLTALLFLGLFVVSSCSSLVESTRKSLLGNDAPRDSSKEVKWVSKGQYDSLMDRYKNLNEKYEKLKDESISGGSDGYSQVDELAQGQGSMPTKSETVDVFAENGLADQATKTAPVNPAPRKEPLSAGEMDQELQYYKKAVALKLNGKTDEALKIFQYLERSSTEQVRVRARAHIGEIYMEKGQYDLALQVYETMIRNDAFSGKVLRALQGAVLASEKLNLSQKKAKYESILRDFFEIEV